MSAEAEAGTQALVRRVSALSAASFAYTFLGRRLAAVVRLCLIPFVAVAIVQYVSLRAYLSELMAFISSGDPRVASLALGALSAGLFITVFILAVAISAIANLALGDCAGGGWIQFRVRRQEWRLYAAYLRLLLLAAGYSAAVYLAAVFILPMAGFGPSETGVMAALVLIAGFTMLFARIGFLIAPIVALSTGAVLRKALRNGGGDLARNSALILYLCVPGLLIEVLGEYLLRTGSGPVQLAIDLPVLYYARVLEQRLPEFVLLSGLGGFVTLVLLTAASVLCYRNHVFGDLSAVQDRRGIANLDSAPV